MVTALETNGLPVSGWIKGVEREEEMGTIRFPVFGTMAPRPLNLLANDVIQPVGRRTGFVERGSESKGSSL